ncbi:MAG: RNA-binding protein [Bdellovibrionales bacterium]|nr:RNA-binding protein [Bdellovibrionales bacterium]
MKVYVGNLSQSIVENDLQNLFSTLGELVSVSIVKDRYSGSSRGFGFVEFESQKAGNSAISKYNGHLLNGAKIVVNAAKEKKLSDRPRRW